MTMLSRVERLDLMMGYLEEIRVERSSCADSTTSSGTLTSDGGNSSVNSTPKSLRRRCRPMDDVVMEAQLKGNLIDRVDLLEKRLLKLQEDIEKEKRREVEESNLRASSKKKKVHRRPLKSLVQSCVRGNLRAKD